MNIGETIHVLSDMNSFQFWKENLFGIFVRTPKKQADLFNPMI